MIKIKNDSQAIELLGKLLNFEFVDEEESSEILVSLEDYQPGIADIVTQSKVLLEPNEVLRMAREQNRPILL